MAAISKPVTNAFVINSKMVDAFFAKKNKSSVDAINRVKNRKKKLAKECLYICTEKKSDISWN